MRHTALAASGLVVMWSSGFVGARLGTAHAAADTLLAWRYVVVAVLLGLIAVVRRPRLTAFEARRQALLGFLCQALYLAGVVTGVGLGVPAGIAALIAVMQPLVVGALSGPMLGVAVRPRQWAGLAAGLVAVAVVVAAAVTGRLAPPMTPGFWWAVLWVVVLSTFGGYGCYLLTLRALGATGASTLLFLTPPTTMVWALLMFGDPIAWTTVVGLAGCAAAVWLVLARPGKARWIHSSQHGSSTRHGEAGSPSRPSATV
jgi:drug/metabolite transporter (DMT)-like permease